MTRDTRLLEDLIDELVAGVSDAARRGVEAAETAVVRPVSVELSLPVEAQVVGSAAGALVHADLPRVRTRTAFDRPLGRLVLRLVGEVAS